MSDANSTSTLSLRIAVSLGAGLLFSIGLGVSGMTDANNVIGFLNLAGDWDYGLGLVMGAALLVYAPTYRWYQRHRSPLLGGECNIPSNAKIDAPLLVGAALFGVGWALGGFCPGPAIVSLVSGSASVLVFVGAMALGMAFQRRLFPA